MKFLSRLFKIERGEGRKVFAFCLLFALLQAGIAIGISLADSVFLSRFGVDKLPLIFLFTPVMMACYTPLYATLLRLLGLDRVFKGILGVLVLGGGLLFLAFTLWPTQPDSLIYLAKFYSVLWFIALYSVTWSFTEDYFDIQNAKRLYALFSGGGACGAILGGSIVACTAHLFPLRFLFLAWSLFSLLAFPVLLWILRRWSKIESEENEENEKEKIGGSRKGWSLFDSVRRSRFTILLTFALFTTLLSTTLCEYQYLDVFSRGANPASLATLLGTLYALANLFNLLMSFLFFNRLVLRIGVANVALIQGTTYLVFFLAMVFGRGNAAAALGFFAYQGVLTSIDFNNDNLLFNAIPRSSRKQVRGMLEGVAEPLASALMGLALLLGLSELAPEVLSSIGVGLSLICLFWVFLLRRSYPLAMAENLKDGWLDFSRKGADLFQPLAPSEVALIKESASSKANAPLSIRVLWASDRLAALELLLALLAKLSPADQEGLEPLLEMMLVSKDTDVVRRLLQWMEGEPALCAGLLGLLGSFGLVHPGNAIGRMELGGAEDKGVAAVALLNGWTTGDRIKGLSTIEGLLAGSSEEIRIAIKALGLSHQEKYVHFLAPNLRSQPNRGVALEAIRLLASPEASRILPDLLSAMERGDARERGIALAAIAKIADPAALPPLFARCERLSPPERREFRQFILSLGLKSVPVIVSVLRDPRYSYAARSIAARSLGELAHPQLKALSPPLIAAEIERAYRALASYRVLASSEAMGPFLLARFYREFQARIVDFLVELLILGGRLPDFELLSASLRSSNPRTRGDAIETLEQGVNYRTFRQLLPLLDPRVEIPDLSLQERDILLSALESPHPFGCSAAAWALWEEDGDRCRTLLRDKLCARPSPLLRDTLLSLLTERTLPCVLEKTFLLSKAAFFEDFGVWELEFLARGSTLDSREPGSPTCTDGALSLIIEGRVEVDRGEGWVSLGVGEVFGDEGLYGKSFEARSEGHRALSITTENLLACATTRPQVAIALYQRALQIGRKR